MQQITLAPAPPPSGLSFLSRRLASPSPIPTPSGTGSSFRLGLDASRLDDEDEHPDSRLARQSVDSLDQSLVEVEDAGPTLSPPRAAIFALRGRRRSSGATSDSASLHGGFATAAEGKQQARRQSIASSRSSRHSRSISFDPSGEASSNGSPHRTRRTSLPAVRVQPASSRGSLLSEDVHADAPKQEADSTWPMTASSLQWWTQRASQGGLGRATAIADNIAEKPEDLMFLIGDEIVLLRELEDGLSYLGCCEGVFGKVLAAHIQLGPQATPETAKVRLPESESMASVSTAADFFVTAPSPPQSPNARGAAASVQDFSALGIGAEVARPIESSPAESPAAVSVLGPPGDRQSTLSFAHRASRRASNPFELDMSSSDGDEGRRGSVSETDVPTPGRTPPLVDGPTLQHASQTLQERRGLGELAIHSAVVTKDPLPASGASPADDESPSDPAASSRRKQVGRSRASNGADWSGIGWMMSDDASLETPSSGATSPLSEAQAVPPASGIMTAKQKRANRRTGKLFEHDGSLSPVFSDDSLPSSPQFQHGGNKGTSGSSLGAPGALLSPKIDPEEPRWLMVEPGSPGPTAEVDETSPPASAALSSVKMPFGKRDSSQVGTPEGGADDSEEEWDIYGDYARDSMFFPPGMAPTVEQRASLRDAARASRIKSGRYSMAKGIPTGPKASETLPPNDKMSSLRIVTAGPEEPDSEALARGQNETKEAVAEKERPRDGTSLVVNGPIDPVATVVHSDSPPTNQERLSSGVSASSHMTNSTEPDALVETPRPESLEANPPEVASASPLLHAGQPSSPPQLYPKGGYLTPTSTFHSPNPSIGESGRPQTPSFSPHTTSMGATKLAVAQAGVSLHGELFTSLTSARNPVPIQFLVGDANYIRTRRTMTPPQRAGSAGPSPTGSPREPARVGLGPGPLPQTFAGNGVPVGQRRPTDPSPLVAKPAERPRSRSFSAMDRIEVPLPMHRSTSTDSLAEVYDETASPTASPMSNLIRKVSRKRSGSVSSRSEARPKTPTQPVPRMPSRTPDMPQSATIQIPSQSTMARQPLQSHQAYQPAHSAPNAARSRLQDKSKPSPNIDLSTRQQGPMAGHPPPQTAAGRSPAHLHPPRIDTALARTHTSGPTSPSEKSLTPRTPITSSPISSKDYHRTMNLDGADFAMARAGAPGGGYSDNFDNSGEPDEWGFVGVSPVPPIYTMSVKEKKALPKLEQTMLTLISKPRTSANQKKVVKLVTDATIPPSLRTKVWAWLLEDPAKPNPRIAFHDVAARTATGEAKFDGREATRYFANHHVFARGGRQMVVDLLNVYAIRHAKRTLDIDTTWIATVLLTKSFHAEEAYWLYDGMANQLRPVLAAHNLRNEAAVIADLLTGLNGGLLERLKQAGVPTSAFVADWYTTLFAHSLPYPTVLRLFDLVLADGPIWLLRFSMAVLTVSADRLIKLTDGQAMIRYLLQPPADELVGPDNLVRAALKLSITEQMVTKSRAKVGNVR